MSADVSASAPLDGDRRGAPTQPLVPSPASERDPRSLAGASDAAAGPSSPRAPATASFAQTSSERSLEAALQERIWSGLASQTGSHAPVQAQRSGLAPAPPPAEGGPRLVSTALGTVGAVSSAPTSPRAVAPSPRASGSYPSASGQRDEAVPRAPSAPDRAAPPAEMPLGYVVASGFFLAIAVVGFGLWLAFEVIAL